MQHDFQGSGIRDDASSSAAALRTAAQDSVTGVGEQAKAGASELGDEARRTAEEVKQHARSAAEAAKQQASEVADAVKQRARTMAENQKAAGATQLSGLAQAIDQAADGLAQQSPQAAEFVRLAAKKVDGISDHVRDRSVEELLQDVNDFARRNQAVFFGVSIVAGFALSRFLRSSAPASAARGMETSVPTSAYARAYPTGAHEPFASAADEPSQRFSGSIPY